ncbi:hypothetical protein cypCar_00000943 [Cyprinus carpio]|nr:hypothetical protein cypCar_00000943 [Cyprinus carpio]
MDRQLIQGQEIRLSLCPPGTSGRSTLAALIAAQGVMLSNKKGLLPEPNLAQFLNSMTNPAALQVLMRPYPTAKRGEPKMCLARIVDSEMKCLSYFCLCSAILGNGLVLQNLLHMQMAQQQLLQIKDKQIANVPGILGDPSRLLLQKVLGLRTPAPVPLGKGLLGDSPTELGQDSSSVTSQGGNSGTGMVSHVPGRSHGSSIAEQNGVTATCLAPEKQPAPPGTTGGSVSSQTQLQNFLPGINAPSLGTLLGCTTHKAPANHHSSSMQTNTSITSQSSCQTSLLGDPPKEVKLPSNPYLNLASVLPGVVLQAPCNSKPQTVQAHTGTYSAEAMQQWYQHYQAQTYGNTSQETAAVTENTKEQPQVVVTSSYGDYSSYMHAVSQYYSQTQMNQTAAQVYQHRDVSKSQTRGQKREYPTLPTQEVTSEGPYVGQHSQGLGGQYADYFKKKRI